MTVREQWWRDYPPPSNAMERAAERMELAAERERLKDDDYGRALAAEWDRAWRTACKLSGRDPDARSDPDGAFEAALAADPCLLMRIERSLGEELARWRAQRARSG